MGRIRTIKPEFFLHEGLFDLEMETGLPVRVAFPGLWCQADRAGRFKWKPRTLKSQILPFDECDFSRVLDALLSRGFIEKYTCEEGEYGWIPTFPSHQVINNKERESALPDPATSTVITYGSTGGVRVEIALVTRDPDGKGEGKGREHGKEGNGNGKGKGDSKSHSRGRVFGPTDERAQHPAIGAVRDLLKKFPEKETWNEIIDTLGAEPDRRRLANCLDAWLRVSSNRFNLTWIFVWYKDGIPHANGGNIAKNRGPALPLRAYATGTEGDRERKSGIIKPGGL